MNEWIDKWMNSYSQMDFKMTILKLIWFYFICLETQEHIDKVQVKKWNIWIWRKNIVYTLLNVLKLKITFSSLFFLKEMGKLFFVLFFNFQHKMALLFF